MSKKQEASRKTVWIRSDHHETIRQLSLEQRRDFQAIIDDVLDTGLKVRRIPILDSTSELTK